MVNDQGKNDTDLEFFFDYHNFTDPRGDGHSGYGSVTALADLRAVAYVAMTYVAPVVAALGLACNLASFLLLLITKLRHLSRSVYLIAICVSDQSFLILLVIASHSMGAVDLYNGVDAMCKMLIYVVHLVEVGKLHAFLLILDTYITRCHPRLATRLCRAKSAAIIIGSSTLVVGIYSLHALTQISSSASSPGGYAYCRYHHYSQTVRLHIADIFLLSALPMLLLVVFSIILCVRSKGHGRRNMRVVIGTQPSLRNHQSDGQNAVEATVANSRPATGQDDNVQRVGSSSLALPLALVVLYCVTLLPVMGIQCAGIYDYIHPGSLAKIYMYYFYIQQLMHLFSYLYFSTKFFLCILCWEPYRRTLVNCIKDMWHQRVRLYGKVPYVVYREDVVMTTVK